MFAKWLYDQIDDSILSSINRILVLTDNEPDDLLFFTVLFGILKKKNLHDKIQLLVVAGEGNVDKTKGTVAFLRSIGYVNFKVTLGKMNMSNEYPQNLANLLESNFNESDNHLVSKNSYKTDISQFLEETNYCLVLCIKSPIELYEMYNENLLDTKKIVYGLYGSVNNRWLLTNIAKTENVDASVAKNRLVEFYSAFANRIVWVESFFAVGQKNTFSYVESSDLFDAICKNELLKNAIIEWNKHMFVNCHNDLIPALEKLQQEENSADLQKCIDSLKMAHTLFTTESNYNWDQINESINECAEIIFALKNYNLMTDMKIIKSIANARLLQVVIADFIIPIVLFEDLSQFSVINGTLEFDANNFTKIVSSDTKNINFIARRNEENAYIPALDANEIRGAALP